MVPIHKKTQSLTIAKNNIDSTIKEIDSVFEHFKVSEETYEQVLNRYTLLGDMNGYLQWVEKINDATQFFTQNQSFKSSERQLKKLRDLSTKAVLACEADFRRVLTEACVKPADAKKLAFPFPDNYELIPAQTVSRLGKLAESLDSCGQDAYLKVWVEIRSEVFKATVKKVMMAEVERKKDGPEAEEKAGRYQKGSHRTIYYLQIFLKLTELEKQLSSEVLAFTNMSLGEIDKVVSLIVEAPLEAFLKR